MRTAMARFALIGFGALSFAAPASALTLRCETCPVERMGAFASMFGDGRHTVFSLMTGDIATFEVKGLADDAEVHQLDADPERVAELRALRRFFAEQRGLFFGVARHTTAFADLGLPDYPMPIDAYVFASFPAARYKVEEALAKKLDEVPALAGLRPWLSDGAGITPLVGARVAFTITLADGGTASAMLEVGSSTAKLDEAVFDGDGNPVARANAAEFSGVFRFKSPAVEAAAVKHWRTILGIDVPSDMFRDEGGVRWVQLSWDRGKNTLVARKPSGDLPAYLQ
jgi:hypothetical protein